ncbi:MAG: tetratricopeptide repeat protein [Polyangiaceae bacterium]|nr:tetratricopeptide repeat protein [Polyangiaceae bacterium]
MSSFRSSSTPPEPSLASSATVGEQAEPKSTFRLAVSRGALGLELAEAVVLGPLRILEFSLTFPGLRYPLDLSGGVQQFRHRRGVVERLVVELDPALVGPWVGRWVGDLLGPLERPPRVSITADALEFGFNGEACALAFDLVWVPEEAEPRFIVDHVRGIGLSGPALGYVERALAAALGELSERRGRGVEFKDGLKQLLRAWLPPNGVRVPAIVGGGFGPAAVTKHHSLVITYEASFISSELSKRALLASEWASFLRAGDDWLRAAELGRARNAYASLLGEAPRHPELVHLIAEIDAFSTASPEVLLGMLQELGSLLPSSPVAARLLELAGEREQAVQSYTAFARIEAFAPLGALALLEAAKISENTGIRHSLLDEAVARCPTFLRLRWVRLEARIRAGMLTAALLDAEQIDALTVGAPARAAVCLRVARLFRHEGFLQEAAVFFERSLRYVPDSVHATAGLARTLGSLGRAGRAIKLLMRAVSLAEQRGQPDSEACLDLAVLLATELKDLPQAIARVRQVTHESGLVPRARFLEGSWRAQLGDRVGASAAFARLTEALELAHEHGPEVVGWLLYAAEFASEQLGEPETAERRLALALRLFPEDTTARQAYERFGRTRGKA